MSEGKCPHRKQFRLREYDNRTPGAYHVIICAERKNCIFGQVVDGRMECSDLGRLVESRIAQIPTHYPEAQVCASVVMPNHVHMLIGLAMGEITSCGVQAAPHALGQIIGGFKASVSRAWGRRIWQSRYYEHIIRGEQDFIETVQYIENNPAAWDKDDYYWLAR